MKVISVGSDLFWMRLRFAMGYFRLTFLVASLGLMAAGNAQGGQLSFSVSGGYFLGDGGVFLPAGTLMQLVRLGASGGFDPVPSGAWVGGDDRVIALPGVVSQPAATAAGFSFQPAGPGVLIQPFVLAETAGLAASGDAVGLRWWPGFTVADFVGGVRPAAGAVFGQVTLPVALNRPSGAETAWVLPPADQFLATAFDPAFSAGWVADFGGVAAPGFSGEPLERVQGAGLAVRERSGGALAEEVLGSGGQTLRRGLYEDGSPQSPWRLVEERLGDAGEVLRAEVSEAGVWLVAGFVPGNRSALVADIGAAGFAVLPVSSGVPLIRVGLLQPAVLARDRLVQTRTELARLRAVVGSRAAVMPNLLGETASLGIDPVRPNDPAYFSQQAPWERIGAPAFWGRSTGSASQVVAIIDTGATIAHPDLAGRIWVNPGEIIGNGRDDDGNGLIDDQHGWDFHFQDATVEDSFGHGTRMAGIIGAAGNNGAGMAGVNWQVRLMILKAGVATLPMDRVIEAIHYAADQRERGVPVGVLLHAYRIQSAEAFAVDHPLIVALARAEAAGILSVMAAGNDGLTRLPGVAPFLYPADAPIVAKVVVAATDAEGELWSGSNRGSAMVDLAAPGVGIYSTTRTGGYGSATGTSEAAAFVAGAAALLRSVLPTASPGRLRHLLLGSVKPSESLAGAVRSGGELNLARLSQAVEADQFLVTYFGENYLNVPMARWHQDADFDGASNFAEWLAGTSPIAATSSPGNSLELSPFASPPVVSLWRSRQAAIADFWLETATDLTLPHPWQRVPASRILGEGFDAERGRWRIDFELDLTSNPPVRFYRWGAALPGGLLFGE